MHLLFHSPRRPFLSEQGGGGRVAAQPHCDRAVDGKVRREAHDCDLTSGDRGRVLGSTTRGDLFSDMFVNNNNNPPIKTAIVRPAANPCLPACLPER